MAYKTEYRKWFAKVIDVLACKLEVANAKAASEIKTYENVFGDSWKRNFDKGIDQYETGAQLYNEIINLN